ncbi:hypothetical protein [Streptomyces sp. NPDC097619]|uniref:hypothetical protein n=1 Tax=Streptomyces sp. NPDC097619 TaxID=3157228 RepID=UPI0033342E14
MAAADLTVPPQSVPAGGFFPPPGVPAQFSDGDRYGWTNADLWRRHADDWHPVPDDGSGWLTDDQVSRALRYARETWNHSYWFEPAAPGARLPGMQMTRRTGVQGLDHHLRRCSAWAQFVRSGDRLLPVRDLVAVHDEDLAYGLAATLTPDTVFDIVSTVIEEQERARVAYDGERLYLEYVRAGETPEDPPATCLHVFVPCGPSKGA